MIDCESHRVAIDVEIITLTYYDVVVQNNKSMTTVSCRPPILPLVIADSRWSTWQSAVIFMAFFIINTWRLDRLVCIGRRWLDDLDSTVHKFRCNDGQTGLNLSATGSSIATISLVTDDVCTDMLKTETEVCVCRKHMCWKLWEVF